MKYKQKKNNKLALFGRYFFSINFEWKLLRFFLYLTNYSKRRRDCPGSGGGLGPGGNMPLSGIVGALLSYTWVTRP